MTIEQAIKKAEKEEWKDDCGAKSGYKDFLLKPLFWQSLGKAVGWEDKEQYIKWQCRYDNCNDGVEENMEEFKALHPEKYNQIMDGETVYIETNEYFLVKPFTWKKQWYKLIDHLAEGKSIESYFKNL